MGIIKSFHFIIKYDSTMFRQDIEFKTSDNVILRGWLYTPSKNQSLPSRLPCLVMSHAFAMLKEMGLDIFAEHFVSQLQMACLVFDNRGLGSSDVKEGQPRNEMIPSIQQSDIQDAITYLQTLPEIDPNKIGVWGASYSGAHCLYLAAVDSRIKAVISQIPLVNGWDQFHRLVRPDIAPGLIAAFQADRIARAAGEPAGTIPIINDDPLGPSLMQARAAHEYYSSWATKLPQWKNETAIRSVESFRGYIPEHYIKLISPTPLLMVVAEEDEIAPTEFALRAYRRAYEPKELVLLPGGHFQSFAEPNLSENLAQQTQFLRKTLCK
jgi:pimeloyl-ACP methyl ester carboxylesterase